MYEMETRYILNKLGIARRFLGHSAALYAIELVLEDETRLFNCKERILFPIAERCGSTPANIEKNLRTAISIAWRSNAPYLIALAGYPMKEQPTVLEFIDIITSALLRHSFYRAHRN